MSKPYDTMPHGANALARQGTPEHELVDRLRAGDRGAAHALYDMHAPRVFRVINRLCRDEEQARELTQDAFVRAFGALDRFRGESAFGTWLFRIAVTVTLNALRKQRREDIRRVPFEDTMPAMEPAAGDPDLRESLTRAIDELSEAQRTVFVLHALEGYTHVEIGELLGISQNTSKGRLFDARAALRRKLAPFMME
ncbi:MAG: sigma-70 family RNA polymerase sigma factor [Gemmatimonadaceae bacterium]